MDFGGMVGEASKSRHSVPNVGASDDVGVDEGTENAAIREAGVGSKLGGFGGTFRRGRSVISEHLGQSRGREWFDGFRVCLARAGGGPAVMGQQLIDVGLAGNFEVAIGLFNVDTIKGG